MIVFDTDHISLLQHLDSPKAETIRQRVRALPTHEIAVTAATLEEQARSWISLIGRYSDVRRQVAYFSRAYVWLQQVGPLPYQSRLSEFRTTIIQSPGRNPAPRSFCISASRR